MLSTIAQAVTPYNALAKMPTKSKNSAMKAPRKASKKLKVDTSADVVELTDSKDAVEDKSATKIEYVSHILLYKC